MLEDCINILCEKAKVYGYEIKELEHAELARFFRKDIEEGNVKVYGIVGYKPDYDIRDDYGNKYIWDQYRVLNKIIEECYGTVDEHHNSPSQSSEWGEFFKKWKAQDVTILNYLYGHPRDGYYHTVLIIKEWNIKKQEPYYK